MDESQTTTSQSPRCALCLAKAIWTFPDGLKVCNKHFLVVTTIKTINTPRL